MNYRKACLKFVKPTYNWNMAGQTIVTARIAIIGTVLTSHEMS